MIRQPIVVCVGHIDHGKSSILDKIRGTSIVATEAGGITQSIGCSHVPLATIKKICGNLLLSLKTELTIPGLLFIDTPGHAAFTNLRKRGGNIADIAVLVVDMNEGFKPQTYEAVEILKQYKTPFVLAANKIDLIPGWRTGAGLFNFKEQTDIVKELLDKKLYNLVGKLAELGFNAERFDRVEDYTKQVAIIPVSAKIGEGIPELIMVLSGLAQRFLEKSLIFNLESPAKGIILEIKKEKGLGVTLDVIIYEGTLNKNDTIVIGNIGNPIVTKVKALFEPYPLAEMRDKKSPFNPVDKVIAASGVKLSAAGIEEAISGMPLMAANENIELVKEMVQKEVEEVIIETDRAGIVVKADSLGSLEALTRLLKEKNIAIKKASIGDITRKDALEAASNYEKEPLKAAVLGFNVSISPEAEEFTSKEEVKIFTSKVIYHLIEEFERWVEEESKRQEEKEFSKLVMPCKIKIMPGYVFRQSNPAIVGAEILAGKVKSSANLMKNGRTITKIKSIQLENENASEAVKNQQVAMALEDVTVGRQINEGDILYSAIPEENFRKLKKLKKYLLEEELELMKEIAEIMRAENPMWGL